MFGERALVSPTVAPRKRVCDGKTAKAGVVQSVSGESAIVKWDGRQQQRAKGTNAARLVVAPLGDAALVPPDRVNQPVIISSGEFARQKGRIVTLAPEFCMVQLENQSKAVRVARNALCAEGEQRPVTVAAAPGNVVVPPEGIASYLREYQHRRGLTLIGPTHQIVLNEVQRGLSELHPPAGAATRANKRLKL